MICKNCRKTIADHTTFCPFCGAAQEMNNEAQETLPAQAEGFATGDPRALGYGQEGSNNGGFAPGDSRAFGYDSNNGQPQNSYGDPNQEQYYSESGSMSPRVTAVVAYITWVGFLIASSLGDRTKAGRFYLNQALIYHLFSLPLLLVFSNTYLVMLVTFTFYLPLVVIFWFIGLIFAIAQNGKRLPLVGRITLIK